MELQWVMDRLNTADRLLRELYQEALDKKNIDLVRKLKPIREEIKKAKDGK